MTKELTSLQHNQLVEQYVELVVDNMDTKTMMQYITDDLRCHFESVSLNELKDEVDNFDEELFDELVDNVTSESYVDSLLTSGTDYPPLVDTEATHDSEGC